MTAEQHYPPVFIYYLSQRTLELTREALWSQPVEQLNSAPPCILKGCVTAWLCPHSEHNTGIPLNMSELEVFRIAFKFQLT